MDSDNDSVRVETFALMRWMDAMEMMRVAQEGTYQYNEAIYYAKKARDEMMAMLVKHNEDKGEVNE